MDNEKFLTLDELAKYLRLSKTTIYRLTQKGEIPSVKIASQWRFKKNLVDAWLVKNHKFRFQEKPRKSRLRS